MFGVVSNVGCPLQWLMFCFMGINSHKVLFFVWCDFKQWLSITFTMAYVLFMGANIVIK